MKSFRYILLGARGEGLVDVNNRNCTSEVHFLLLTITHNNYLVEKSVVLGELNIDVSAWVNSHSLVANVRDLNLTIATGTQVEAAVDVGSSGASSTNL